jgi:LacI family transcriptional regulator
MFGGSAPTNDYPGHGESAKKWEKLLSYRCRRRVVTTIPLGRESLRGSFSFRFNFFVGMCWERSHQIGGFPMGYTLEEIAEMAHVSRSTVSRVINGHPNVSEEVKERVWKIVREVGYQPHAAARSLATNRSNILALIIPEPVAKIFTDPFFPVLIKGMADACNDHRYNLMLSLFTDREMQEEQHLRVLRSGTLDGAVIASTTLDDPLVPRLLEDNVPFVMVGSYPDDRVSYVDVDNVHGGQMAVEHLLRLGHRRVATITGPLNMKASLDRLEGYKRALRNRGLPIEDSLVAEGDFTEQGGYSAMKSLLKESPTAVFVASDTMAFGAARAIRDSGLSIPQDVAVVGFDDLPVSSVMNPPLTTIRQPIERLGYMATEVLVDIMQGKSEQPQRLMLPTELVVRQSCGGM